MRWPWKRKSEKQKVEDFCLKLNIDKEHDVIIFDPFVISTKDLLAVGVKNLVRIRRPHWGKGEINKYILALGFDEFKRKLNKQ